MMVGIIITLCFWMAAWSAKPYDTVDLTVKRRKIAVRSEIGLIVKNKPLLMLMIAFGTDMLANSALLAVNMYYFKYVLGREELVPATSLALTLTGVAANLILPKLVEKMEKKRLYCLGSLLAIVPLAILLIRPVVPDFMLIVLITVFGLVSALPSSLAWVMLSDCTDYSEYLTGIEGSGVVSSTFAFINKFSGAIGASMASYFLGKVGFAANQEQTGKVLLMIVFLRFGIPIIGYAASLISMHFYELTEEKNREICKVLAERAGKNGESE